MLEDIQDKYDKIPGNKRQALIDVYEPCIEVLEELDKLVLHYNGLDTKSKRAWDRLRYDPSRSRGLRERLTSSVLMLNSFYTSLIHDSHVLILEALERLEKDYRGGHREDSIASIARLTSATTEDEDEDENEDEAWTQILRDLEDVGVSQRQALRYRAVIVDWLVAAVNEGRLLEEPQDRDIITTISQDLEPALFTPESVASPYSLDVPAVVSPVVASSSAPLPLPSFISDPTVPQDQTAYASPSTTTEGHSPTTFQPESSGFDTDPLYAQPEPFRSAASSADSSMPVATLPHEEQDTISTVDLEASAAQIVDAWIRNDVCTAEQLLRRHLIAVERGQTSAVGTQPDRRILRHLLGVCATLDGNFVTAKSLFESVFNGIYLNRQNLDDGDVAAARWLGDVCLQAHERENAILAYSVAYEGSIGRLGNKDHRTRQVRDELKRVGGLQMFRRFQDQFRLGLDPTTIFLSTNIVEKRDLIESVKNSVYEMTGRDGGALLSSQSLPLSDVASRPDCNRRITEASLLGTLVSPSDWLFQWDPAFSPNSLMHLAWSMNTIRAPGYISRPLSKRQIPKNPLGESDRLQHVTKRGLEWLINAVKEGLDRMKIPYGEYPNHPAILCCFKSEMKYMFYYEGVEIHFRRLPFRNLYGVMVTDAKWATRRFPTADARGERRTRCRDIVRDILHRAEAEAEADSAVRKQHVRVA